MSKSIVIIQGSLNPHSRTAIVCEATTNTLTEKNVKHEVIDLRTLEMQFCDGRSLHEYNHDISEAFNTLEKADAYIIGMPVYQYSVSGPLKNFLDITMDAMKTKPVGIVCNSGGPRSYLASAELMKLLSFECQSICVQPTVHTSVEDFEDGSLQNSHAEDKIEQMIDAVLKQI